MFSSKRTHLYVESRVMCYSNKYSTDVYISYVQIAKQGCDRDGERVQSYRFHSFFFFFSPIFGAGSRCSWMNTSLQFCSKNKVAAWIVLLRISSGHEAMI